MREARRGRLETLSAATRRWIQCEQIVNERFHNNAKFRRIDPRSHTVRSSYWPEQRGVWAQRVVWLPTTRVRTYGPLGDTFRGAFGLPIPRGRAPLLLHPQAPPAHRALAGQYGDAPLGDVLATPTASYRSVLAWRRGRPPAMLKLSIGATIGRSRRRLRENQIARAVLQNALFDTIPDTHAATLGFDWCPEPAGMVETLSRHGWLLREFPRRLGPRIGETLVPMFSLISARGEAPPMLVELIRRSGRTPEAFVLEELVEPYVESVAYLLFVQGLQIEGHAQNTLVVLNRDGELTRRTIFRDLSDTSVSIPLRIARRKVLPSWSSLSLPTRAPFPLTTNTTDVTCNEDRAKLFRAFDTVERYGFWGYLWTINASIARYLPGYRRTRVERAYLTRWQDACRRYIGVTPLFRSHPIGVATDEALAHFLQHVDWAEHGLSRGRSLPALVQPTRIGGPVRRRAGPIYDRVDCAWGDLYLDAGLPVFFRPAF